jgi:hypothetical protein
VFQLQHGGGGEFEFEKIFQVLGGQLGVWSPLIFILLIVISISLIRKNPKEEADRFVLWTSLPVFIFFCGNGLFGDFLPHWPAAGWWTGTIAVAAALIHKTNPREKNARRWQRWTASAGVIGLVLSITLYAGLLFPVVAPLYTHAQKLSEKLHQSFAFIQPLEPFKPKYDVTNDLFGWNDIAAKVEKIKASMPNPDQTFVFSHRFFTASQVSVFLDPQTVSTTLRNKMDQYHLWFDPEKYLGWDALFVDEGRYGDRPLRYRPLFEKVNPQGIKFEVYRQGYLAHRMTIYKYFGFKGQFEK